MKYRTGLLLSAAFAMGVLVSPVTVLLRQHSGFGVFTSAQAQQDSTRSDPYTLLNLFADVFEKVRADYVEPPKDREMIENALSGMLSGLDPHSRYINARAYRAQQVEQKGEFGGLGIEITAEGGFIKVISPIDDTPAKRAGVKAGDLIVAIDGATVLGMSLEDAVDKIKGAPNTKVSVTIRRIGADKPIELSMTRETIKTPVVKSRLEGDVAYIRLSSFMNEQGDKDLRKAFTDLKSKAGGKLAGVILDLRSNPGGLLDQAVAISTDFLKQGEVVSIRGRHPEDGQRWQAKNGDITDGLPVVVMIDGGSASASEIVAGALQDHRRAVLVGTRSFGKGSVQTVSPLGNNGAMALTTARYYTPSGRSIQGLGITPDVEVAMTREERPSFFPAREADYKGILSNTGGAPTDSLPPRTDLPAIAKDIPKKPPEGTPAFDPAKPETDYQLQQALIVLHAMSPKPAAN